jgi:hypothetical protein
LLSAGSFFIYISLSAPEQAALTDKKASLPIAQRGFYHSYKIRAYLSRVNFTLPLALITACAAARRAKPNYYA